VYGAYFFNLTTNTMKKLFILLVIMCMGFTIFAQNPTLMVGEKLADVQKVHPKAKVAVDSDGDRYISHEFEYVLVYYYFNSDGICYIQTYSYHKSWTSTLLKALNSDDYVKLSNLEYLRVTDKMLLKYTLVIKENYVMILVEIE
jgi:hypothetical protein